MSDDPRVDAYLAGLPGAQRDALEQLRGRIAHLVPDAVETMAYGMPAFRLGGRFLVSFAGWKSHCTIYPLPDAFARTHADELKGYQHTKGSLHFTPQRPLPERLLGDLVRARVAELTHGRADTPTP